MRTRLVRNFILALVPIVFVSVAESQDGADAGDHDAQDPWGALKSLEGSWQGAIDGRLGRGTGVRRYEFIMGGRFLMVRHLSVRLPQEKSPAGDEHEELAVYSIDSQRNSVVLREFLSEGVVVLSSCDLQAQKVVCASQSVESGPGIRARLTLEIENRYQFTETYEIAWTDDQELQHYFTNQWTRVPIPQTWD